MNARNKKTEKGKGSLPDTGRGPGSRGRKMDQCDDLETKREARRGSDILGRGPKEQRTVFEVGTGRSEKKRAKAECLTRGKGFLT